MELHELLRHLRRWQLLSEFRRLNQLFSSSYASLASCLYAIGMGRPTFDSHRIAPALTEKNLAASRGWWNWRNCNGKASLDWGADGRIMQPLQL